jgi:glycosyltransferase involved in cell wall biosynthesis
VNDGPSISIVTSTYNAVSTLPGLIDSLRRQTFRKFEWIVVDGASTDATVEVIRSAGDVITKWISEPDFGIYDALNKAIRLTAGDFYVVLGADDRLEPDAIERYRTVARESRGDVITARIWRNGKLEERKRNWPWLYAHHAYVSEHSVGTLLRRSLHSTFGYYSKWYPIGADVVFLKTVCGCPGIRLVKVDFVAGTFGFSGTSRIDRVGAICDYFRAQFATEKYKLVQIFLFVAKVLWNAIGLVRTSAGKQKVV